MTCPRCGGVVERVAVEDGGCIEETVWTKGGLRRKVRPATFNACTGCEWCSEFNPAELCADCTEIPARPGRELCESCQHTRDNYDGPPDGEAWSGGFADNH